MEGTAAWHRPALTPWFLPRAAAAPGSQQSTRGSEPGPAGTRFVLGRSRAQISSAARPHLGHAGSRHTRAVRGQRPGPLQCTKAALFQAVHRLIVFLKTSLFQRSRPQPALRCQLKAPGAKDCHRLTGFSSGKPLSCQPTLLLPPLLALGTPRAAEQHVRISESLICGRSRTKGCKR